MWGQNLGYEGTDIGRMGGILGDGKAVYWIDGDRAAWAPGSAEERTFSTFSALATGSRSQEKGRAPWGGPETPLHGVV